MLRIIPRACQVVLQKRSWEVPPIFHFLQEGGHVAEKEMMHTFNNGIGLVAVVPEKSAPEVLERIAGLNEIAYIIGEIGECSSPDNRCEWV